MGGIDMRANRKNEHLIAMPFSRKVGAVRQDEQKSFI